MEGTPFGRYQLIELLGRGGMGEVWRAYDTAIDRVVALKMLLPHYATDPEFDKRFRREARAAARLDDPHVVPIHDVGEIDGRLYVTMRLINGVDLATLLGNGPLDTARAVYIVEQIASALHSAHQAGLVHRDVKPSNILLADKDFAYLIDFGIAHATGDTALTSANTTIGTWAYMAPERFKTGESAPSSDVYALACVLYQCLTGEQPFPGNTLEQVAVSHMVMPPPRPSEDRRTIPTAMDQVIATGLAKLPTERYPSAVELAAAARHAITQPASQMPPPPPAWPHSAPTQPWQSSGAPPAPARRRHPAAIIGAVAGAALLVAAGVVAAVNLSQDDDPRGTALPDTSTTGTPSAPTEPFTGTFRAAFSAPTLIDGGPLDGTRPSTASWALRSACRSDGCVATASRLMGDGGPPVSNLVFDELDGRWVAVGIGTDECHGVSADIWYTFTLQQGPDGNLTGDYLGTSSNACSGKGTVTFTRIGDADVGKLPDPATLPPRVGSPAEALHGRYSSTRTFSNGLPPMQKDYTVATDCLRTGERCMSYFHSPSDFRPLVFGGGTWTLDTQNEGTCPDGRIFNLKATGQYPMPQPPQDPIPVLSGHGHWVESEPCAVSVDFDETFTRTGD